MFPMVRDTVAAGVSIPLNALCTATELNAMQVILHAGTMTFSRGGIRVTLNLASVCHEFAILFLLCVQIGYPMCCCCPDR